MLDSIAWKVGGDQGEGVDSTGDVVATVATRMGYHTYGYKSFSSRIRGGHTWYTVRISPQPVASATRATHMLVALTQETIDRNAHELVTGGMVVADESFKPVLPDGSHAQLLQLPMTTIAREVGGILYRNMVAVGASARLLNLPLEAFLDYASTKFARKGEAVVQQNLDALKRGFTYAEENFKDTLELKLPPGDGKARLIMSGNDAVALGALAAGCRIMAAYPITPATDIMETLTKWFPKYGGAVLQMEDEMAAISVCIGAGYGGARAMTATSGPGFSLMQEIMGLSSTAEIPLVVVDTQRAGPSTGMPTKHEQSDAFAAIYGGHGESPRIVLAPSTPEEAFQDGVQAFNLAEQYQCPVIIASDLALAQWRYTVDALSFQDVTVNRGAVVSQQELLDLEGHGFRRYEVTEQGISPRALPGMKGGQYLATGVEHNPFGKVSEDPQNRVAQMQKRFHKMEELKKTDGATYRGPEQPEVLVIGFGSTRGAIEAAIAGATDVGIRIGHLHVRRLSPFPVEQVAAIVKTAGAVVFVENNATSQLRRLMMLEGIDVAKAVSVLKYDGTLFTPEEVFDGVQSVLLAEEVH